MDFPGRHRQLCESYANSVVNSISDSRTNADIGSFSDSFSSEWSRAIIARQQVIRNGGTSPAVGILYSARLGFTTLPSSSTIYIHKCGAQAEYKTTIDLTLMGDWIDHGAHVRDGGCAVHRRLPRLGINFNVNDKRGEIG